MDQLPPLLPPLMEYQGQPHSLGDSVREAIRAEFDELRTKLIEAVRLELAGARAGSPHPHRAPTASSLSTVENEGGRRQFDLVPLNTPKSAGDIGRHHSEHAEGRGRFGAFEHAEGGGAFKARGFGPQKPHKFGVSVGGKMHQYKKWLQQDAEATDQLLPAQPMQSFCETDSDSPAGGMGSSDSYVHGATQIGGGQHPLAPPEDGSPTDGGSEKLHHEKTDSLQTVTASVRVKSIQSTRAINQADKKTALQQFAERLVRHPYFEFVSMVAIILSSSHIGAQTDYMARNHVDDAPSIYRALDVCFLIFFSFELVLRLFVHRLRYFYMYGCVWNWLDFFLIVMQIIEELVQLFVETKTGIWASLLRVVRILRAVRVVRVAHAMQYFEELRFMVECVMHSCKSFHWAALMIGLMVYVFGVHLTHVVHLEHMAGTPDLGELDRWFGNVPRSGLSLFEALTGGVDWDSLAAPLSTQVSPYLGVLFVLYMSFALLAVMNVITGTFVQHAMERAQHNNEIRKVRQASLMFATLDSKKEGFITFEEIEQHLELPAVRDFFRSLDIDLGDAQCLFDTLDSNNTGKIEFETFLGGAMRLQGPARAIDLLLVMRELREIVTVQTDGIRKSMHFE